MDRDRLALHAFAELLGYPGPGFAGRARTCARTVVHSSPGAALRLERFARECEASAPERLEELYTAAFDPARVRPVRRAPPLRRGAERRCSRACGRWSATRAPPGGELPITCEVLFLAARPCRSRRVAHDGLRPPPRRCRRWRTRGTRPTSRRGLCERFAACAPAAERPAPGGPARATFCSGSCRRGRGVPRGPGLASRDRPALAHRGRQFLERARSSDR
jgi:hypothetical protein